MVLILVRCTTMTTNGWWWRRHATLWWSGWGTRLVVRIRTRSHTYVLVDSCTRLLVIHSNHNVPFEENWFDTAYGFVSLNCDGSIMRLTILAFCCSTRSCFIVRSSAAVCSLYLNIRISKHCFYLGINIARTCTICKSVCRWIWPTWWRFILIPWLLILLWHSLLLLLLVWWWLWCRSTNIDSFMKQIYKMNNCQR
jgi:hypothetical protein